jgi:hypothetical protein
MRVFASGRDKSSDAFHSSHDPIKFTSKLNHPADTMHANAIMPHTSMDRLLRDFHLQL